MDCGHVTIEADDDSSGHTIFGDPYDTQAAWQQRRDRYRNISTVIVGRIITILAGALAEIEIFGECAGGDGDDQYRAMCMLQDLGRDDEDDYVRRLRRQARNLVRRHREKIERVAAGLMAHGTLAAEEIEAIMRRG
jgi:hypothetical protein